MDCIRGRVAHDMVLVTSAALAVSLSGCGQENATAAPPSLSCPTACPTNISERVTKADGFTTNTGFDSTTCCDICAVSGPSFPAGKNGTYDWDIIAMDALFVPQFCRGLVEGHDLTLTNVKGSTCAPHQLQTGFQIHGLWPNYNQGFPSCCNTPQPLNPDEADGWDMLAEMRTNWASLAVAESCGACFTWNHEWQKHGGCFAAKPQDYFQAGLHLFAAMQTPLKALADIFAKQAGGIMNSSAFQAIWSKVASESGIASTKVLASCDQRGSTATTRSGEEVKYFAEVQWCYRRRSNISYGVPVSSWDLELIDCPPSQYACDIFAIRGADEPAHVQTAFV